MKIAAFLIDGVHQGLITDNPHPFFSFHLESDQEGACLEEAKVVFEDGYELLLPDEVGAAYQGSALKPFSKYKATLHVKDRHVSGIDAVDLQDSSVDGKSNGVLG